MVSSGNWKKVNAGFGSLGKKLNKNFSKEISPVIVSLSDLKKDVSKLKEDYRKDYAESKPNFSSIYKSLGMKETVDLLMWTGNPPAGLVTRKKRFGNNLGWFRLVIKVEQLYSKVQDIMNYDCGEKDPMYYCDSKTMEVAVNALEKFCNIKFSDYINSKEDVIEAAKKHNVLVKDSEIEDKINFFKGQFEATVKNFKEIEKDTRDLMNKKEKDCEDLLKGRQNFFMPLFKKLRENYARHKKTCEQYLRKNKINILPQAKAEYKFIKETLLPYINGRIEKLSDANIQAFLKEPPAKKEKGE